MIKDQKYINTYNRDLTKDNRYMSYLSQFEQHLATQQKMKALYLRRESLKYKRDKMESLNHVGIELNVSEYKPVVISQQSKNEQPLFQDESEQRENLKNQVENQLNIKN